MPAELIRSLIRDVPDFPKKGILFKDITPVLEDPAGLKASVDVFVKRWQDRGIDRVVGIESRGFLFGAPVAYNMGLGFSLVRKQGKLPWKCIAATYDLEYGSATLEVHVDSVEPGMKVVVVDDLLATGGTAAATVGLLREIGAEVVEAGFLVELSFLPGREKLAALGVPVFAPVVY